MRGEVLSSVASALSFVTVEPIMLVDGACKEAMLLFIENVQLNKICTVKMGFSQDVCSNLTAHPEHSVSVQREFSIFAFYNSIILSVIPLIFILFMGAWSDKYGRKMPLLLTLLGHLAYAGGYLLVNSQPSWPVEVLYAVTSLEALGGANVGILTSTISYISDITTEKQRTSRLNIINSLWYLGAPIGTLVGAFIIKHSSYHLALGLVFLAYFTAIVYIIIFIKESHGPFAETSMLARGSSSHAHVDNKEKKDIRIHQMLVDLFNWRRVVESFKTAFMKREGNKRVVLIIIIIANMIRRMARSFFMYMFVRRVLSWDATEYGYWITYRNFLVAIGSLVMVPLLTKKASLTDTTLVMLGSLSIVAEYTSYGVVDGCDRIFFMWLGPVLGVLSNAYIIALRSMSTKLVTKEEKGRISGVSSALNGLMPMAGYALYSPVYYHTVTTFPAAQFVVGAGLNLIIMITFIVMTIVQMTSSKKMEDEEDGGTTNKSAKAISSTISKSSVTSPDSNGHTLAEHNGTHINSTATTTKCPKAAASLSRLAGSHSQDLASSVSLADGSKENDGLPSALQRESQQTVPRFRNSDTRDKCLEKETRGSLRPQAVGQTEATPRQDDHLSNTQTTTLRQSSGGYTNALTDEEITASERKQRSVAVISSSFHG